VDDLTAFCRARLDEAAASAWAVHDVTKCGAMLYAENMGDYASRAPACDCGYPTRALREVEAKRAIVSWCEEWLQNCAPPAGATWGDDAGFWAAAQVVLAHLAAACRGHPDWRQEWAP
jgi:hypothetical protein